MYISMGRLVPLLPFTPDGDDHHDGNDIHLPSIIVLVTFLPCTVVELRNVGSYCSPLKTTTIVHRGLLVSILFILRRSPGHHHHPAQRADPRRSTALE